MSRKKQTCSTWNSRSKCTRFFYVRNFSSSCYWWIPLSQPEVPIRWGCKGDCERMCVTRGEEGKLELQQDRMIASALSWGLADPILSLSPNTELAHEGHKFGETQILPWPNRSPCFSCTFLYLFPRGIYQPHLFSKLWPSRNFCFILLSPNTSWCKRRESDGRPPS